MQQYSKQDVKNIIKMVVAQFGEGPTGVDEFVEVVLSDYTPPPSSHQGDLHALPIPVGQFIIDQKDVRPHMMGNGAWYHYEQVCNLLNRYKSQPAPPTPVEGPTPTVWKEIEEELIECYEDYPAMNAEQDARKKIDEWKAKSQQELKGRKGLRWVKVTERQPTKKDNYWVKIQHKDDTIEPSLKVDAVWNDTYWDCYEHEDWYEVIEWLEESDSPAPEQVDVDPRSFAEWVDIEAVRNGAHKWTIGAGDYTKHYTTSQLLELYKQQNKQA